MLRQNSSSLGSHTNGFSQTNGTNGLAPQQPQGLDLQQQLQRLEEIIVLEGTKVPLTRRTIIDEEQLLSQLLRVERSVPETIRAAEQILQQKADILAQAHTYAQDIIEAAKQQAAKIADQVRIVQQAEREAQQIRQQVQEEVTALRQRQSQEIEQARQQAQRELEDMRRSVLAECEQVRRGADTYADRVLKDMEQQLSEMLHVVQNGRHHLQGKASQGRPQA